MPAHLKINFVSDVSCPWCVIGLRALQQAVERNSAALDVELHFEPFELNPQMPPGGQDIGEHIAQKYGSTLEQFSANSEAIRARGATLGFTFNMNKRGRIYNTFDAHRLLHWAGLDQHHPERQLALKTALFDAYFTLGLNPEDHAVLTDLAVKAGLDRTEAQRILATDAYAAEVRAQEDHYRKLGINSVPAIIINDRHLISGGQPVEVFEQALREIAAGAQG